MNTISRSRYLAQKQVAQRFLLNNPQVPITHLAGIIAASTECPIVIVCQFLGELTGFTPELLAKMERMKAYHRISDVID